MRDIDLAGAAGEQSVASEAVAEAVAAGLGALLSDRDVTEIGSLEGGSLDVLRRGTRQRLDIILEGPLFALLREAGAETAVLTLRLPQGHELVAGALVDGRIALRVKKATALDATLAALVEEGVLAPGVDAELCAAVLEGAGVVVIGPARGARRRVLAAIVRALTDRLTFFAVTDALSSLVPVALSRGAPLLDKARAAAALGADALAALDLSPAEAVELARAQLGVPWVVAIAAPSMDALSAVFADAKVPLSALGGTTAVIGHGPAGDARLVELHGPTRALEQPPAHAPHGSAAAALSARGLPPARSPLSTASTASMAASSGAPAEVSGLRHRPAFAERRDASGSDDELPPLAELPDAWASDHADDDPGWELGEAGSEDAAPPAPGSFDAALAARKGKPSPAPRSPPQGARRLGGDPFGGLTLEPPPGGPARSDDDDEGAR